MSASGGITLTLNTPATVTITAGVRREVWFTAPSAGTYRFTSSNNGSLDPKAFTASGTAGDTLDDDGAGNRNYTFDRTMSAGATFTYWSGVYSDENVNGSYTVTVTRP